MVANLDPRVLFTDIGGLVTEDGGGIGVPGFLGVAEERRVHVGGPGLLSWVSLADLELVLDVDPEVLAVEVGVEGEG